MSPLLPLAFGIGAAAGLRAFTPVAVVSWAAHAGHLDLHGTALAWMSSPVAVAALTLLALAELAADKWAKIPNRTSFGPLAARIFLGGLAATALGMAAGQTGEAVPVIGAIGAIAGTFVGFNLRVRAVRQRLHPDLPVALIEDAIAIGLAAAVVALR